MVLCELGPCSWSCCGVLYALYKELDVLNKLDIPAGGAGFAGFGGLSNLSPFGIQSNEVTLMQYECPARAPVAHRPRSLRYLHASLSFWS